MKLKNTYLLVFIFFFAFYAVQAQSEKYSNKFNLKSMVKGSDYLSNVIIVKLKSDKRDILNSKMDVINGLFNDIALSAEKMFPEKSKLESLKNSMGQELVDLSLIYTITFDDKESVENVIDKLYATAYFEYAEPYFIPELLYTPNDPNINNQYYLQRIKAYEAWDIEKGDSVNVYIGIVDTGTDLTHPDLMGNIKYNYDDPIDGLDNDNDGFVDNFNGWDMGEGDNNPSYSPNVPHGVHVCGISSATADNAMGIAGVGFKCKFLPVKATNEFGVLTMAYQGIVYAADKGCKIINCSWGKIGGDGQFGQDIVNYATYNKNAVIVASAGNNNTEQLFVPASYENVISVAATDQYDIKWSGSSYNVHVDLSAPGYQIFSTWASNSYLTSNGTSMAAPIVSGCAAIVASHFPNYSSAQIAQRLKVTADVIDTIITNSIYANKLGSGRVNLYNALTMDDIPSVNMISFNYTDEDFGQFSAGDTVLISGDFVNYLAPTTNLKCTLTSLSPYCKVLDSIISFPTSINTLDTANSAAFPFKILIKTNMPVSYSVDFKLLFSDTNYTEKQYFSKVFNVDYLNIDTNKVKTTFTSKSRIGYNDISRYQGIGLLYTNSPISQLGYGGLIVGASPTQVSDNIYGSTAGSLNNGFFSLVKAHRVMPTVFSDFDVQTIFNDSLVGVNKLNIEITNNMFAWNNVQDEKFIITEYYIVNKGLTQINNMYAGLFMDWEIEECKYHRTDFDLTTKMGYSYSTQGSSYAAIKLLTTGNYKFYGFDNINGININDGFSNYEKYNALRTNKFQAGESNANNDIANLFSSGPFNLNAGDTVKVAFAIILGDYLSDISQSVVNAQDRYNNLASNVNETPGVVDNVFIFPNPASDFVSIYINNAKGNNFMIEVSDNIGKVVKSELVKITTLEHQTYMLNIRDLKSGIYVIRVSTENKVETKKLIVY